MRDVAEELGGRFSDPLEHLNRVVTVHPLGGCPMGRNPQKVVNEHGAVFGCPPGLYVADGSVMPGPVGRSEPDDTIAALADRFAGPIIARKGAE